MNKFGVNSTRAEKRITTSMSADYKKTVVCASCGKKFVKQCPNEDICDISILRCPNCGADIK